MTPSRKPEVLAWIVAGCGALAACAWPVRARAEEPAPPAEAPDQRAILTLVVNRVEQGEVDVVLRGDDVLVQRSDLEAAKLHDFTATDVVVGDRTLVSLQSVRPALHFTVDEEAIALRVDAPVSVLPTQRIDLGWAPPPELSRRSRASAFLNYAPQINLASSGPAWGSAFFEGGVSEQNRLWYSGVYAATTTGVVRGLTNLTIDDRPRMMRLTLGDTTVSTGAIGGAATIGGVTLARDFSMNPYFIRFPSMRFTATTTVPATVDVYVNGIRVRSEPVDPGTFTLDNVRGVAGAGNVRYVIRNALGQEQAFNSPYYVGPSVFAKGVDDFAMSVGLPRERLGAASFEYAPPAVLAYYQRGVTDTVTLGGRAEGNWGVVSGGPYVATVAPFGMLSLEGGASATVDGRAGLAAVFAYQYLSRTFSAGASVRALTDEYATTTLDSSMDRSLLQTSVFTSVPVGKRASLSTSIAVDVRRDVPSYASVGFLSQVQIAPALTLLGQLALATQQPPVSTVNGFVMLSWTPVTKVSVTAGAQTSAGVTGLNAQFSRTAGYGEDWSIVGAVNSTPTTTEASIEHRLQTETNVVATFLDWRSDGAIMTVQPAGSVVWIADNGFFLSRPVLDSFALVRVPNIKDVRITLNGQDVGRTNASGNRLVPSLISFYGSELKIASEDVPMEYSLEKDTIIAAPPRRGAAYAEFAAPRAHYYRGRLRVVQKGKEIVPIYGDFAVKTGKGEIVSPIGEDGTFELEGIAAGKHSAEIRHRSGICAFTFVAKDANDAIIDLGLLRCHATPPAVSSPQSP